jgi:hypothetical protein
MGLDRTIRFHAETPSWEAIQSELRRVGFDPSIRMIDGLPAFPDEKPEPTWKELRVGFPDGMVTLRRVEKLISCVVWGNAEGPLKQAWDALSWACASSGNGLIDSAEGPLNAESFARSSGLCPS